MISQRAVLDLECLQVLLSSGLLGSQDDDLCRSQLPLDFHFPLQRLREGIQMYCARPQPATRLKYRSLLVTDRLHNPGEGEGRMRREYFS